jgi:hypothetical protein
MRPSFEALVPAHRSGSTRIEFQLGMGRRFRRNSLPAKHFELHERCTRHGAELILHFERPKTLRVPRSYQSKPWTKTLRTAGRVFPTTPMRRDAHSDVEC